MTSWEPLWDDIYKSRAWGMYPSENLIRFIARHYYSADDRKSINILDLGCGSGANTWYLAREGFNVSGIDGSENAISILGKKLDKEGLQADLHVGDIGSLPFSDGTFDCIVDVNCLMCNDYETSKAIISHAATKVKKGGRIFSMMGKAGSWGDGLGQKIGKRTYKDAAEGPYANMGTVRFTERDDIYDIYGSFEDIEINSMEFSRNNGEHIVSFWLVNGVKK